MKLPIVRRWRTLANPRKPTALKIAEGTFRKDRAVNEPTPSAVDISKMKAPVHFDDAHKEMWDEYVKELVSLGVLTVVDRMAFEVMFEIYIEIQELKESIIEEGKYIVDDRGNTRRNPLISQVNQLRQTLRQFLSEFGMTPASRTKINVKDKQVEESALEKLMRKKMNGA